MTTRTARLILEADSRQIRTAGGDLKALDRQAGQTERSTGRMGRAFGISTRAIAAGAAVAGAALVAMVRSVANTGDELSKLSERTGVAVEDLSRLQFAAELSDVSNQQLADGFKFLARSMSDTQRGTGEAQHAFAAMGIEVTNTDGTLRKSADVLKDVADRFSSYEDGAQKSALAQKIFGRSGAELVPLLNQGAAGLQKMGDESDRLGRTMSGELARASVEFNDNLTRIKSAATGTTIQIAGPLITALANLTTRFFDATVQGKGFFEALARGIGGVDSEPLKVATNDYLESVRMLHQESATLARRRLEGASPSDIAVMERHVATIQGMVEKHNAALMRLRGERGITGSTERVAPPSMAGEGGGTASRAPSINTETDAIQRQVDALVLQAQTYRMTETEATLYALSLKEGVTPAQIEMARAALETVDAFRLQDEQVSIAETYYDNTRTAAERLAAELARLQELLNAGVITWDTYTRAVFEAEDQFDSLAKEKIPEVIDKLDQFRATAAERLQGVFADALTDPFSGSLEEMGRKWSQFLQRLAAEALAKKLTESLFGAGTGGGGLLSSFGKFLGLASGGTIPAGQFALTGERGPEIVRGPATVTSTRNTANQQSSGPNIRIINAFDPSFLGDWLGSTSGEEMVMNIVRRNQSPFAEV